MLKHLVSLVPPVLDAIGPAKNATKAIGPVADVANAIKNTALKINIILLNLFSHQEW